MYRIKEQIFRCSKEQLKEIIEDTMKAAEVADSVNDEVIFGSEMIRVGWVLNYMRAEPIQPVFRWYMEYQVEGFKAKRIKLHDGVFFRKQEEEKEIISLIKEGKVISSFKRVAVHPEIGEVEAPDHFYLPQKENFISLELAEMMIGVQYHSDLEGQKKFFDSHCETVRKGIYSRCLSIVEREYSSLKALKSAIRGVID